MALNQYVIGDSVTVQGSWTDHASGLPVDPTDARVDIVRPTGVSSTYTYAGSQVTRVSVGVYTYVLDTTALPGRWQYRWWSPPGSGQTAGAGEFLVSPFPVPTP